MWFLCNGAVQKINVVFSKVNDEFEEFSYTMKLYTYVTCLQIFALIIQNFFLEKSSNKLWWIAVMGKSKSELDLNRDWITCVDLIF